MSKVIANKIRVEITKDDPIGLNKGDIKNLSPIVANALIKNKQAKLYKQKEVEK